MKKYFLFICTVFLFNTTNAQDLIVFQKGDSINCKISKIKDDFIYFKYASNDKTNSTLAAIIDVKFYQKDFYKNPAIKQDKTKPKDYSKFRLGINSGYSYRTAPIADGLTQFQRQYMEGLKPGIHFGGEFSFFISETNGIGLKLNLFENSNRLNNVVISYDDGSTAVGTIGDDISILFIGPKWASRIFNKDKTNAFNSNIAIGYTSYVNNQTIIEKQKIKANSLGFDFDIGYDFGLSEHFSLGFQLGYFMSFFKKYTVEYMNQIKTIELQKDNYESLNRLDLSIGVRYNF